MRFMTESRGTFLVISESEEEYRGWFSEGKTSLLPKPGDLCSENQRPITCLNNIYKWFTSCPQSPMDSYLEEFDLMEGQQRGAMGGCSGTTDNLSIGRMVTLDCHRGNRNLNMAWVDVRKAYDLVDHTLLAEVMRIYHFSKWLCRTISHLAASWNTKIVAVTKQGPEISRSIRFIKGLPQGGALCSYLFTLCLNPVAWLLGATERYTLSKAIGTK